MTVHIAIANGPDSDHELIVNVQQSGAQTQWIIQPGQQTMIAISGPHMDVIMAEGKRAKNLLAQQTVKLADENAAERHVGITYDEEGKALTELVVADRDMVVAEEEKEQVPQGRMRWMR